MRTVTRRRLAVVSSIALAGGVLVTGGPALGATPAAPRVAVAAPTATNGLLAYSCNNRARTGVNGWVTMNADGSNKVFRPWGEGGTYAGTTRWSPDGTELVSSAAYDPGDGTAVMLTEPTTAGATWDWRASNYEGDRSIQDSSPAWQADGRYLSFARSQNSSPQLYETRATGDDSPDLLPQVDGSNDQPFEAPNGDIYYVDGGVYIERLPATSDVSTMITTGFMPQTTPDGSKLSYLTGVGDTIYESDLDGANSTAIARFMPGVPIRSYSWSPDGTKIAFASNGVVFVQSVPMGQLLEVGGYECTGFANGVSWQAVPSTPEPVVRASGADRVGTSIAVSHTGFADQTADAVVLADSLQFPDALSGAPLAAKVNGPLLLTPSSKLDPRVLAEINRVLKPTSQEVYVLGGLVSLSQAVEDALVAAGYHVTRFAGTDRYDTSLKVAQFMGSGATAPQELMLATGTDFPDGLSAGAAAGSYWDGTPDAQGGAVLLTKGAIMPATTAQYVADAIAGHTDPDHPVYVSEVGGLAAKAYSNGPQSINLAGADRYQTSMFVAEVHFAAATSVGIATGTSFPDALSGGALAAEINAPLLMVPPSLATFSWTSYYLHAMSASIGSALVFGGPVVVSDAELHQVGPIIGLHSVLSSVTDVGAATGSRATAASRARALVAAKAAPGTPKSHPVVLAPQAVADR